MKHFEWASSYEQNILNEHLKFQENKIKNLVTSDQTVSSHFVVDFYKKLFFNMAASFYILLFYSSYILSRNNRLFHFELKLVQKARYENRENSRIMFRLITYLTCFMILRDCRMISELIQDTVYILQIVYKCHLMLVHYFVQ